MKLLGVTIFAAIALGCVVALSAAALPEPATWAILVAGFGILGAGLRRRRAERRSITA